MDYLSEDDYDRLQAQAGARAATPKMVETVRYDQFNDLLVMTLPVGLVIGVPVAGIDELARLPKTSLSQLRLSVSSEVLILDDEDVHISIRGLLKDVIASMPADLLAAEFAARGGASRSTAKKAASASNGRLGGRPRKVPASS